METFRRVYGAVAFVAGLIICSSAGMTAQTKAALSLDMAKKMVAGCEAKAKQEGWKMNIAIVDDGSAVDTMIAVKWNFYCFVSRWHESVLEVRAAASSPRATARPFGQRGLTPPPASNQGPACDRRLDVAQQPIANAGSKGLPVFRTPKHRTNNLRIAATTICLGLSRPRAFNRVTSATIAGLYRIADIAGM